MIKINLATRKSAILLDEKKEMKLGVDISKTDYGNVKATALRALALPLAVGFAASFLLDGFREDETKKLTAQQARVQSEAGRLRNELNKFKEYEGIKKALEEDEAAVKQKLQTIQKLTTDRAIPSKVLVAISTVIPKEVWLSELKLEKTQLHLKGAAAGFNQISDFMKNLGENAMFSDVSLKSSKESKTAAGVEIATFEVIAKRR